MVVCCSCRISRTSTDLTSFLLFFYWKFRLKRKTKQRNKQKDTSEATGIPTGSTDTLKITILKTWEACDQANKKIAKLLLLHLLVHTCTKKHLINITFDSEFSTLFYSLPLFILELFIHLILVKPILFSPMSIRFLCLSLASFHWWKVKACESSRTWPQNQCEPVKVHLNFSSVLNHIL